MEKPIKSDSPKDKPSQGTKQKGAKSNKISKSNEDLLQREEAHQKILIENKRKPPKEQVKSSPDNRTKITKEIDEVPTDSLESVASGNGVFDQPDTQPSHSCPSKQEDTVERNSSQERITWTDLPEKNAFSAKRPETSSSLCCLPSAPPPSSSQAVEVGFVADLPQNGAIPAETKNLSLKGHEPETPKSSSTLTENKNTQDSFGAFSIKGSSSSKTEGVQAVQKVLLTTHSNRHVSTDDDQKVDGTTTNKAGDTTTNGTHQAIDNIATETHHAVGNTAIETYQLTNNTTTETHQATDSTATETHQADVITSSETHKATDNIVTASETSLNQATGNTATKTHTTVENAHEKAETAPTKPQNKVDNTATDTHQKTDNATINTHQVTGNDSIHPLVDNTATQTQQVAGSTTMQMHQAVYNTSTDKHQKVKTIATDTHQKVDKAAVDTHHKIESAATDKYQVGERIANEINQEVDNTATSTRQTEVGTGNETYQAVDTRQVGNNTTPSTNQAVYYTPSETDQRVDSTNTDTHQAVNNTTRQTHQALDNTAASHALDSTIPGINQCRDNTATETRRAVESTIGHAHQGVDNTTSDTRQTGCNTSTHTDPSNGQQSPEILLCLPRPIDDRPSHRYQALHGHSQSRRVPAEDPVLGSSASLLRNIGVSTSTQPSSNVYVSLQRPGLRESAFQQGVSSLQGHTRREQGDYQDSVADMQDGIVASDSRDLRESSGELSGPFDLADHTNEGDAADLFVPGLAGHRNMPSDQVLAVLISSFGWGRPGGGQPYPRVCFLCRARCVNVIFYNCLHVLVCRICARRYRVCPRCGQDRRFSVFDPDHLAPD